MAKPAARRPTKVVAPAHPQDLSPQKPVAAPGVAAPASEKAGAIATLALLALAVGLVYARALDSPFFFDDLPGIVDNPSITRLWPLVGEAGNRGPLNPPPLAPTARRPLVNLSFALDYHFHGLDPAGYHVVNLIAHVLAAAMLAALVRRTLLLPYFEGAFGPREAWALSLVTALLWAVHPLNSEAVAYVTQRTELFAGLAYVAMLYAALRYWTATTQAARRRWVALAGFASVAGIASKEIVVSAPIAALLFELTFLRRPWRDALRSWPLYAALALGWLLLVPLNASGIGGLSDPHHYVPLHVWWMTQAKALFLYLKLSLWPWPLAIHYAPRYLRTIAEGWPWIVAAAVAAGAVAALVWKRPTARFVALVVAMVLAPTFVIPLPKMLAAERRMYLALAALIALAVAGCYRLLRDLRPQSGAALPLAAAGLLIVLAGATTARRLAAYESPLTIWQDSLASQPDDPMAHNNLGVALADAGRSAEAMREFEAALALDPKHAGALVNLGTVASDLGRTDEARRAFEQALALDPDDPTALGNLGAVLTRMGRPGDALAPLQRALALAPDQPKAKVHSNLGNALIDSGRAQEGLEQLRTAVRLRPGDAGAQYALGAGLLKVGQSAAAIAPLAEAVRLGRRDAETLNLHASALLGADRAEEAVRAYQNALEVDPGYVEAYNNLATAYLHLQRSDDAIRQLEEALRRRPDYASARFNLATAFLNGGRAEASVEHFEIFLRLQPDDAQARFGCALALARTARAGEARAMAESALALARAQGGEALASEIAAWLAQAQPPANGAGDAG